MNAILVLMVVVQAAMLGLVYRWFLGEFQKMRSEITALRTRLNEHTGDIYTVNNRAESASRTAHNALDRVREMYVHKDDVEALAAALGAERHYSPEQSGWRKKSK